MARRTSRRSPDKQAALFVRKGLALGKPRHRFRDDGLIHSIGTARSYQQALKLFCRWIRNRRLGDLRSADVGMVQEYLNERQSQVGQKTLDRERQAAQFLLRPGEGEMSNCGACFQLSAVAENLQNNHAATRLIRLMPSLLGSLLALDWQLKLLMQQDCGHMNY